MRTALVIYTLLAALACDAATWHRATRREHHRSLRIGLVSYWDLSETSDTRRDSEGRHDLTDSNTVLSGTGNPGVAADIERDNSESLDSTGDHDDWDVNADVFYMVGWLNLESLPTTYGNTFEAWSHTGGAGTRSWKMYLGHTNNQVYIEVSNDGSTVNTKNYTGSAMSVSTWYLAHVGHDGVNDLIYAGLDASRQTKAHTTGLNDTSVVLKLGEYAGGSANNYDGLMQGVAFFHRVLSSAEVTLLYNGGTWMPLSHWW